tara:strand:+ start:76393 stop:76602 length:210 start_codon:yes stop_codon:yes gene_type:complete
MSTEITRLNNSNGSYPKIMSTDDSLIVLFDKSRAGKVIVDDGKKRRYKYKTGYFSRNWMMEGFKDIKVK